MELVIETIKRPKDMTQEELEALPTFSHFGYKEVRLPHPDYPNAKGSVFRVPYAKIQLAYGRQENDIICFADRDNVLWGLILCEDGWNKTYTDARAPWF